MRRILAGIALMACLATASAQTEPFAAIQELRLRGMLQDAMALATKELSSADQSYALDLNLELAKIHDRIGLHTNTRPVAAALQYIEAAAGLAGELDASARARVDLAYAEYFYRAEMAAGDFEQATRYADQALVAFQALEDFHGQADAVHRLGLIRMQQGDLDQAQALFEESLQLDRNAGERGLLRADYERHVAFVYALQDEYEAALPYYQRSLVVRQQIGAQDPAMFAAISLAATLVELGRADAALVHLEYAGFAAAVMGSQTGKSRVQSIIERLPADQPLPTVAE
jgi:tetratricopeptide (TPR) repeat protein